MFNYAGFGSNVAANSASANNMATNQVVPGSATSQIAPFDLTIGYCVNPDVCDTSKPVKLLSKDQSAHLANNSSSPSIPSPNDLLVAKKQVSPTPDYIKQQAEKKREEALLKEQEAFLKQQQQEYTDYLAHVSSMQTTQGTSSENHDISGGDQSNWYGEYGRDLANTGYFQTTYNDASSFLGHDSQEQQDPFFNPSGSYPANNVPASDHYLNPPSASYHPDGYNSSYPGMHEIDCDRESYYPQSVYNGYQVPPAAPSNSHPYTGGLDLMDGVNRKSPNPVLDIIQSIQSQQFAICEPDINPAPSSTLPSPFVGQLPATISGQSPTMSWQSRNPFVSQLNNNSINDSNTNAAFIHSGTNNGTDANLGVGSGSGSTQPQTSNMTAEPSTLTPSQLIRQQYLSHVLPGQEDAALQLWKQCKRLEKQHGCVFDYDQGPMICFEQMSEFMHDRDSDKYIAELKDKHLLYAMAVDVGQRVIFKQPYFNAGKIVQGVIKKNEEELRREFEEQPPSAPSIPSRNILKDCIVNACDQFVNQLETNATASKGRMASSSSTVQTDDKPSMFAQGAKTVFGMVKQMLGLKTMPVEEFIPQVSSASIPATQTSIPSSIEHSIHHPAKEGYYPSQPPLNDYEHAVQDLMKETEELKQQFIQQRQRRPQQYSKMSKARRRRATSFSSSSSNNSTADNERNHRADLDAFITAVDSGVRDNRPPPLDLGDGRGIPIPTTILSILTATADPTRRPSPRSPPTPAHLSPMSTPMSTPRAIPKTTTAPPAPMVTTPTMSTPNVISPPFNTNSASQNKRRDPHFSYLKGERESSSISSSD